MRYTENRIIDGTCTLLKPEPGLKPKAPPIEKRKSQAIIRRKKVRTSLINPDHVTRRKTLISTIKNYHVIAFVNITANDGENKRITSLRYIYATSCGSLLLLSVTHYSIPDKDIVNITVLWEKR